MLELVGDDTLADVYGETFMSAQTRMAMLQAEIEAQRGKGFETEEACAQWAKEHFLDLMVHSKSQKCFYNIDHHGEMLTLGHWKRYYSDDVLFWWETNDKGKSTAIPWIPKGNKYHEAARVQGEQADGIRQPISHRDYFTPTGFYDTNRQSFNTAKPFPCFAKQTGRDTSHIYTFIEHLGGSCAPYLLAWLRQKCLNPYKKTEVVPILSSRQQGTGKTTFAEVICRALFGADNVVVTDKFDTSSRFNAEWADALIVCAEEKNEDDKRVDAASLKSMATAPTVRKEYKGIDPIIQASYTEFIVTTNKDVPIKFDSEDQRRFMMVDVDQTFHRYTKDEQLRGIKMNDTHKLADEVFTKLYGMDALGKKTGTPLVEDKELVSQFKHELISNEQLASINPRDFPRDTATAQRSRTLPRTGETVEIEAIMRTLAPFIRASLLEKKVMTMVNDGEQDLQLSNFLTTPSALQYMPAYNTFPAYLALCRPLVFYDQNSSKPFNHATVERGILDCSAWLLAEYGLQVMPSQLPLPGGFMNVMTRYRQAPAARFILASEVQINQQPPEHIITIAKPVVIQEERIGQRLRVNGQWKVDPLGEYETVNEMKPGVNSLSNKSENVAYLDTFLFEADDVSKDIYKLEQTRITGTVPKNASTVFMERLRLQKSEADRLLDSGIAFRAVYSGGKSYHVLVRIKDAPQNVDEYKWLHAHLCNGVISNKLDYDVANSDPARLTRAPIEKDRMFTYNGATVYGKQRLYREMSGQVYDYKWRPIYEQWLNRPLDKYEQAGGKRLVPAKQEYKDAMLALISGTFWTDSSFNGRRQQCFFPAYRLARFVGFSHDQLWSPEGVLDGIDKYYRKSERDYWRTREDCDLIKQIDADVDAQLEDIRNG